MNYRLVAPLLPVLALFCANGCFSPSLPETGVLCGVADDCPPAQRCELVTSSCVPGSWPVVAKLHFEPFSTPFEASGVHAVQVSLLDAQDRVVPISGGRLNLALAPAPVDISLAEDPRSTLVEGVATFANVRLERPAKRLQLVASGGALSAVSAFFDVRPTRPVTTLAPPTSAEGCAEIGYTVAQAQGRPVDVLAEVDPDGPDGPAPFRQATQAPSAPGKAGVRGVQSAREGREQTFSWNASADVGAVDTTATLRFTASVDGLEGASATHPVQVLNGLHLQPVSGPPLVLAIADLDRDGWPDLVEARGNDLMVYYGPFTVLPIDSSARASAMSAAISFASPPDSVAVGDFDHDGKLDLVATTLEDNMGIAYAQAVPRTFGSPKWVFGTVSRDVIAADVNGDGRDDIVAVDRSDGTVSLSLQGTDAANRFNVRKGIFVGSHDTGRPAFADVDHNGELDLLVGRKGAPVAIRLQDTGKFNPPVTVPGFEGPMVAAADLDRDGRTEVIALGPSGLQVLEVGLDDDLSAGFTTFPGFMGTSFTLGDIDGDGQQDVVTAGAEGVEVHLHASDRTKAAFAPAVRAGSRAADVVAVADFDRDGRMDVVSSPAIFLNRTPRRCGAGLDSPRGSAGSNVMPLADLDGDGKLDMLALDPPPHGQVQVWYGLGDGAFAASTTLLDEGDAPVRLDGLAVADLDQDGLQDRVEMVAGDPMATVRVQDRTSPGSFASHPLDLGLEPRAIAVGDVDLDGAIDVLAMGANQAVIIPGDPRHPGSFLERKALPGSVEADGTSCNQFLRCTFLVADLDGDGWPEIVAQTDHRLRVYAQDPVHPGEFGAPGITDFESVQIKDFGDVVGDLQPELLVVDSHIDNVLDALSLQADGTLRSVWSVTLSNDRFSAAIADFDHDGKAEIALGANHESVRMISPREVPSGSALPAGRRLFAAGTVSADDLDSDGRPDLLVCAETCLEIPSRMIVSAMSGADFWAQVGDIAHLIFGDLTGDGLLDLLIGNHIEHQLAAPAGHFEIAGDALREDIQAFTDLDHDGFADVLAGAGVMDMRTTNNEFGVTHFTCGTPMSLQVERVADLDRDGQPDVVQWGPEQARLVRDVIGDCVISEPFITYPAFETAELAEVRDMNNDGWPDVVTELQPSGMILVSLQRADAPGSFLAAQAYAGGRAAAIGDIDHDGWLDVVLVDGPAFVYRGTPLAPGSLTAKVPVVEDGSFQAVQLGDVDGDGWLDLALGTLSGGTQVRLNDGVSAGSFRAAYDTVGCSSPDQPASQLLIDLDADGRLDFFFSDRQRGSTLVRGR